MKFLREAPCNDLQLIYNRFNIYLNVAFIYVAFVYLMHTLFSLFIQNAFVYLLAKL